jgi:hypothetical protein
MFTLLLPGPVQAGWIQDIGSAVFNATKQGIRDTALEEAGMTGEEAVGHGYQGSTDNLMGTFYWGLVSNPDHFSASVVRAFWWAVYGIMLGAYMVYVVYLGIRFMTAHSPATRAELRQRAENGFYGVALLYVSYYVYAILVYAEASAIAALNIDMSSFIVSMLAHGHLVPLVLTIILFFVMSLLLIARYFFVWIGPIPFTVGLGLRFMDTQEEPGTLGRIGTRLISYSVGMIYVQFVVAFYLYMMIVFYEAHIDEGWFFQSALLIGILVGAIYVFWKCLDFMSGSLAQRATRVIITKAPMVGRGWRR